MYKQTILLKQHWSKKLHELKKRYATRQNSSKTYDHIKQMCENNVIYCWGCGESLEQYIGQNIVVCSRQPRKQWYCVPCARLKKLI